MYYYFFYEFFFVIKFICQSEFIVIGIGSERVVNVSDQFFSDGKKVVVIGELSVILGWNKMWVFIICYVGYQILIIMGNLNCLEFIVNF